MKKSTRTLTDIRNELVRARGNLEAIKRAPFTEEDREILTPKYLAILKELEDEERIKKTPVVDPEIVKA